MCRSIRCCWPVALLLVISAIPAAGDEPDADVLTSESFENGKDAPDGWDKGAEVRGVKYVYDRNLGSDGKRSLSLQKSENRYFPIAEWSRQFKHTANKPALKLTTKVKAAKAAKAIIDVRFLDDKDEWIKHEWIVYIGQKEQGDPLATHDWNAYEGTTEIPGGTKQISIALQIYGPGKVWFDELEVRYVDPAKPNGVKTSSVSNQPPRREKADSENSKSVKPKENPADDVANVPSQERQVGADANKRYFLIGAKSGQAPPENVYRLLVVMPGGDGSADFHPFVKRIYAYALSDNYLIAQPIAVKWTTGQQVVWPTKTLPAEKMQFGTEEFVEAVIDDVAKKYTLDRTKIFTLSWSSSGHAAYAISLQPNRSVTGSFVAMSVYPRKQLPPLDAAKGHAYYIYHSKQDQVCPYRMAEEARTTLSEQGATVHLETYSGGHGWSSGQVFEDIREGVEWLEQHQATKPER